MPSICHQLLNTCIYTYIHTCMHACTVWRETLVGGNIGELIILEHLVKESLANSIDY